MAEKDCDYMGNYQWFGLYYVLYYTVFLRWAVDTLREKKEAVIEK